MLEAFVRLLLRVASHSLVRRLFPKTAFRIEWLDLHSGPHSCVVYREMPTCTDGLKRRFEMSGPDSPWDVCNSIIGILHGYAIQTIDVREVSIRTWDVSVCFQRPSEWPSYSERLENGDCEVAHA